MKSRRRKKKRKKSTDADTSYDSQIPPWSVHYKEKNEEVKSSKKKKFNNDE